MKRSNFMNQNLGNISPEKINVLTDILEKSKNVTPDNMVPFLLNAASQVSAKGITFSDEETQLILNTLRKNMNRSQLAQMEHILQLSKNIHRNS